MVTTLTTIVYTVDELSHALSLGKNSTYELVNRPDFPKIRVGRKYLIPKAPLDKWLEDNSILKSF